MSTAFDSEEMVSYAQNNADENGFASTAAYIVHQLTLELPSEYDFANKPLLEDALAYAKEYQKFAKAKVLENLEGTQREYFKREIAIISCILPTDGPF